MCVLIFQRTLFALQRGEGRGIVEVFLPPGGCKNNGCDSQGDAGNCREPELFKEGFDLLRGALPRRGIIPIFQRTTLCFAPQCLALRRAAL